MGRSYQNAVTFAVSPAVDAGHGVLHPDGRQSGFGKELCMKLLTDLFSTDYGLMSIAVIAITLGMAGWFALFFRRKMREDARNADQ